MPRGDQPQAKHQLARILLIGDGKCGKTDWAARAIEGGFNVLYLDADIGTQTIMGLPKDLKNPISPDLMKQIFIMNVSDTLVSGGLDYRFVKTFKRFTSLPVFRWNDTAGREFSIMTDGDETTDEIWEITPAYMDHTCVLVIDSWTSLAQSAMNWAADDLGIDIGEISEEERTRMRTVYQAAGEKLNQFLIMIRSMKCHVVVIAHPREFTKRETPPGKTAREVKEADMRVLWTKMVLASSSNNHAFSMTKFFTDIGWLEISAVDQSFMIDFRASHDRLSGSHVAAYLNTRGEGSFVNAIRKIGATIPGSPQPTDRWLTIHSEGYKAPDGKKPELVLGASKSAEGGSDSPAPMRVTGQPFRLNLTGNK